MCRAPAAPPPASSHAHPAPPSPVLRQNPRGLGRKSEEAAEEEGGKGGGGDRFGGGRGGDRGGEEERAFVRGSGFVPRDAPGGGGSDRGGFGGGDRGGGGGGGGGPPPERRKLQLAPRSKPKEEGGSGPADSGKPNPFGGAKPRAAKADDYLGASGASEAVSKPVEGAMADLKVDG